MSMCCTTNARSDATCAFGRGGDDCLAPVPQAELNPLQNNNKEISDIVMMLIAKKRSIHNDNTNDSDNNSNSDR